jgi:hypothetical protein
VNDPLNKKQQAINYEEIRKYLMKDLKQQQKMKGSGSGSQ